MLFQGRNSPQHRLYLGPDNFFVGCGSLLHPRLSDREPDHLTLDASCTPHQSASQNGSRHCPSSSWASCLLV